MTWNPIIPCAIFDALPKLTGGAVKVALALAKHADRQGRCFPSVATLADGTGLKRRAVQRALAELTGQGLIAKHVGGGRKNPNHYVLKTASPATPFPETNSVASDALSGVNSVIFDTETASPTTHEGIHITIQETICDSEKLLQAFHAKVKPRALDKSGSRKIFLATATRLLQQHRLADLLAAVENYVTSERGTEEKYRKGFQAFFGAKAELYRDFLPGAYEPPPDPQADAHKALFDRMLETGALDELETAAAYEEKFAKC
jgi:hypothetical protein